MQTSFKTELDASHCTFSGLEKYLELDVPLDKEQTVSCMVHWSISPETKEDGIHAININIDQVKASFEYEYTDSESKKIADTVDLNHEGKSKLWSVDIEGLEFSADGSLYIRRVFIDFTDRIISLS